MQEANNDDSQLSIEEASKYLTANMMNADIDHGGAYAALTSPPLFAVYNAYDGNSDDSGSESDDDSFIPSGGESSDSEDGEDSADDEPRSNDLNVSTASDTGTAMDTIEPTSTSIIDIESDSNNTVAMEMGEIAAEGSLRLPSNVKFPSTVQKTILNNTTSIDVTSSDRTRRANQRSDKILAKEAKNDVERRAKDLFVQQCKDSLTSTGQLYFCTTASCRAAYRTEDGLKNHLLRCSDNNVGGRGSAVISKVLFCRLSNCNRSFQKAACRAKHEAKNGVKCSFVSMDNDTQNEEGLVSWHRSRKQMTRRDFKIDLISIGKDQPVQVGALVRAMDGVFNASDSNGVTVTTVIRPVAVDTAAAAASLPAMTLSNAASSSSSNSASQPIVAASKPLPNVAFVLQSPAYVLIDGTILSSTSNPPLFAYDAGCFLVPATLVQAQRNKEQLEFVLKCFMCGVRNKNHVVTAHTAHKLMVSLGSPGGNQALVATVGEGNVNSEPMFRDNVLGYKRFAHFFVMSEMTIKSYFGKSQSDLEKQLANLIEREIINGLVDPIALEVYLFCKINKILATEATNLVSLVGNLVGFKARVGVLETESEVAPFSYNYHYRNVVYEIDSATFGGRALPTGVTYPEGVAKKYINESYTKLVLLLTAVVP